MDADTRKLERMNGKHDFGIVFGMALAAAILARDFDDSTRARKLLGAAGIDRRKEVKDLGMDEYDEAPLLRILDR